MNIDDIAKKRITADMYNSLNRSVDIIKLLEALKLGKNPDPVDFIIALSTYAEFCKQDLIKNIVETNLVLERKPHIKEFIDSIARKELGNDVIDEAEAVKDPKEIRATLDRITAYSTGLILKQLDNRTISEKINSLLKRFEK